MNSKLKVLWAVDPLEERRSVQANTYKALDRMIGHLNAEIEPVAMLRPEDLKLAAKSFKGKSKKYELQLDTSLKKMMSNLKDERLIEPRLLVQNSYSMDTTVTEFLKYARQTGASLIAVGTHTKKGIERFFLGSFAETLILKSEIPILIVNPKSKIPTKIKRVFFPTDFSDASHKAFLNLLDWASSHKAEVVLYHKVEYLIPETMEMVQVVPDYRKFLESDLAQARSHAHDWTVEATERGVKVKFVSDEKGSFLVEALLKNASHSKSDMIALAARSGAVATIMVGSVVRQVVRAAKIPVWVVHPRK